MRILLDSFRYLGNERKCRFVARCDLFNTFPLPNFNSASCARTEQMRIHIHDIPVRSRSRRRAALPRSAFYLPRIVSAPLAPSFCTSRVEFYRGITPTARSGRYCVSSLAYFSQTKQLARLLYSFVINPGRVRSL